MEGKKGGGKKKIVLFRGLMRHLVFVIENCIAVAFEDSRDLCSFQCLIIVGCLHIMEFFTRGIHLGSKLGFCSVVVWLVFINPQLKIADVYFGCLNARFLSYHRYFQLHLEARYNLIYS